MKKFKTPLLVLSALLVLTLSLKMTGTVDMSWWVVLLPALLPLAVVALTAILLFFTLLFAPNPDDHDN